MRSGVFYAKTRGGRDGIIWTPKVSTIERKDVINNEKRERERERERERTRRNCQGNDERAAERKS
jgi:hypothetical protein